MKNAILWAGFIVGVGALAAAAMALRIHRRGRA
jgi:hypothetical protein